ncbi:High-affinity branched-chain amino acid transport ATP-binding protein LivF [Burkholderiales bacterium]|nr:MAG: ABC transporter ATP-binding protein [Burkholderiales bacterium]CAG0948239.1 High-affinity branched-chain amino acid transport ATP-binding protein LivF [Burkholderiales bacterium]
MLHVQSLSSYHGHVLAVAEVNLKVEQGELVALVGANGAGKTTLLRTLSGVHHAARGSVSFCGEDITRANPARRVRLGMAQVPEGRQVFGPLSVEDNLMLGGYLRPAAECAPDLEMVYGMFPILKDKRKEAAGTLSGGQQQMLALGRALLAKPRLLLLDEPSMGLAPNLVAEIFAHIASLKSQMTILLVDQNARGALAIADRAYVLETGRIVLEGSGAALAADARVQEAYLGL